jgi:hypothetical protein
MYIGAFMVEGKTIYPLWMLPIFVNEDGEFVEPSEKLREDIPIRKPFYDWH